MSEIHFPQKQYLGKLGYICPLQKFYSNFLSLIRGRWKDETFLQKRVDDMNIWFKVLLKLVSKDTDKNEILDHKKITLINILEDLIHS